MRALVYHGPGERGWDSVPDPAIIDPTDIIVAIDTSTICGTDLHILKGDVPETVPGTILGHEAVGTVQEIGAGVTTVAPGDRVLMSCVSACGRCRFCKEGRYGQCLGGGGWIFGHLIDGLQAEYARVPFADNSVYKIPDGLTRRAGAVPGRHPAHLLRGRRAQRHGRRRATSSRSSEPARSGWRRSSPRGSTRPGASSPSTWPTAASRRARRFGADLTINNGREDAVAMVMELTDGLGADVAIEAVGVPDRLRAGHRADPSRRTGGQHRRARQASHAAPGDSCGPAM